MLLREELQFALVVFIISACLVGKGSICSFVAPVLFLGWRSLKLHVNKYKQYIQIDHNVIVSFQRSGTHLRCIILLISISFPRRASVW